MDLDNELNFSEICRCCKRTESEMTSIFDGNVHPTYPPVKEMLSSIASLNVQENDELPSLICASCLNNIQDAFTFILQVTLIQGELSQMLTRRKQALSQSTFEPFDANLYILTTTVKKEVDSEPVEAGAIFLETHQVKVEDLDEPVQNFYEHWSTDENIDLIVKSEVVIASEIEEAHHVCDMCNKVFDTARSLENHKIIYCGQSETQPENSITTEEVIEFDQQKYYSESDEDIADELSTKQANDKDLLTFQTFEDIEGFEDVEVEIVGVDDVEDGNSLNTSEPKTNLPDPDAQDAHCFSCNLCVYRCSQMTAIKRHLLTHSSNKPFACSKCNRTFVRNDKMLRHWRNCNGEIKKHTPYKKQAPKSKQMISLTLQDLKDPEKMRKYYTYTGNDSFSLNDDDEGPRTTSKLTVFKCTFCTFTSVYMYNLRQHLQAHSKDRPFSCLKCKRTFTHRANMMQHCLNCNGEMNDERSAGKKAKVSKHEISLEDLKDPLKMKSYYTVAKIDVNNDENDDALKELKEERAEDSGDTGDTGDTGDDVEIEETCRKRRKIRTNSKLMVYKCRLCTYTSTHTSHLNGHLESHLKDKPFVCSKCNSTFSRHFHMMRHWGNCNGEISKYARKRRATKQVISLTQQDLKDPVIMRKYYTVSAIDV